jgi:catechol 2,3-dioxygenase-like lactoylglutathione lyase family enzyme
MPVVMDHQVIPARDKDESASFLARIMGLVREDGRGHFAPVRLDDGSILDFETRPDVPRLHFAFRVTEAEFDDILARLRADGVPHGPLGSTYNGQVNTDRPGRGIYFPDPSGHSFEVITQPYASQR